MKRTLAVTVMCVAMLLMGAHARADDPQSRCTRIGNNWVQFNNSKDISTAFDVFTEDIEYNDIPTDPAKPVAKGRDEFLAFVSGFFYAFPTIAVNQHNDALVGYYFKFVAKGDQLTGYVSKDGQKWDEAIKATDSELKAGQVGFSHYDYRPLTKEILVEDAP